MADGITDIADVEVAELAAQLIAAPSPNPPGDVRAVTDVVLGYLRRHDLPHRLHRPAGNRANVVCTVASGSPGPHLVLSGHLDTFPLSPGQQRRAAAAEAGPPAVFGRGASDMKGGVAAFLVLARHFARAADRWSGRLTLCLVCDEETFGPHGVRTLLADADLFRADAVLSAEPSGRGMIRFGERGPVWGSVRFDGPAGHGAYATGDDANVIVRAGRFVDDLTARFAAEFPAAAPPPVPEPGSVPRFHPGADRTSLNIGAIRGGTQANTKPSSCTVEVDVRVPVGLPAAKVVAWLRGVAEDHDATYTPAVAADANVSDTDHALFAAMADAVRQETGLTPGLEVALGSTDARHWRRRGVPAAQYGADPLAQAMPNENVPVRELGEIARVHARTALAVLTPQRRPR